MKTLVFLIVTAFMLHSPASATDVYLRIEDINDDINAAFRQKDNSGFLYILGDFNDDQKLDTAGFVAVGDEYQLIVDIGDERKLTLYTGVLGTLKRFGISKVSNTTYETLCAKGYGSSCLEGEPETFTITGDAIKFFQFESSAMVFHWESGKFTKSYISD